MDSAITAFITLILVLEAAEVRAGKVYAWGRGSITIKKTKKSLYLRDDLREVGTDDGGPGDCLRNLDTAALSTLNAGHG